MDEMKNPLNLIVALCKPPMVYLLLLSFVRYVGLHTRHETTPPLTSGESSPQIGQPPPSPPEFWRLSSGPPSSGPLMPEGEGTFFATARVHPWPELSRCILPGWGRHRDRLVTRSVDSLYFSNTVVN